MGVVKICLVIGVLFTVIFAIFINFLLNIKNDKPEMKEDGWWGRGPRQDEADDSIRKVKINIPEEMLIDLTNRLRNTRFQMDFEEGDFNYGFQSTYMRKVIKYWLEKYDWRKHEAVLNKYDHFKTKIEGLEIHYTRVKPNTDKKAIPLLLIHGWPGSVWEFYKALPLLTDGNQDVVFEVICPSIPGYGYSDTPMKKGFGQPDTARIFMKLMKRLGFENYYVQGGDWGSFITNIMAIAYPQYVSGIHINMILPPPLPKTYLKQIIGIFLPSMIFNTGEAEMIYPLSKTLTYHLQESGYFHIQATKPDTVAMGLTDSPVGLAAYILEKFSTWTNKTFRNLPDGGLTQKFTLDELLTNIMIYWTNGNIVSSVRYYKEAFSSPKWNRVEVTVPTGMAIYPEDLFVTPRTIAADIFTNIVQYTAMTKGGHFAAFEEPDIFVNDVRSFVRKVEEMKSDD